jgi:hypothetical protein
VYERCSTEGVDFYMHDAALKLLIVDIATNNQRYRYRFSFVVVKKQYDDFYLFTTSCPVESRARHFRTCRYQLSSSGSRSS